MEFASIFVPLLLLKFFLQELYFLLLLFYFLRQFHHLLFDAHRNDHGHIAKESMFPQHLQNSVVVSVIKLLHYLFGLPHETFH